MLRLGANTLPTLPHLPEPSFQGAILHRGIKTPVVDARVKAFLAETQADGGALRELGLALLREPLPLRPQCPVQRVEHRP